MGQSFTSEGRKPLHLFGVTRHGEYLSARGHSSDDAHEAGEVLSGDGLTVTLLSDLPPGLFLESGDTIPEALQDPIFLLITPPAPEGQKEHM